MFSILRSYAKNNVQSTLFACERCCKAANFFSASCASFERSEFLLHRKSKGISYVTKKQVLRPASSWLGIYTLKIIFVELLTLFFLIGSLYPKFLSRASRSFLDQIITYPFQRYKKNYNFFASLKIASMPSLTSCLSKEYVTPFIVSLICTKNSSICFLSGISSFLNFTI